MLKILPVDFSESNVCVHYRLSVGYHLELNSGNINKQDEKS